MPTDKVKGRLDLAVLPDLGPGRNFQEHCRTDPGLLAAGGRMPAVARPVQPEKAFFARAARARVRGVSRIGRGRNMVFPLRGNTKPSRARRHATTPAPAGPRISPSSCCPSRTSLAMRARTILPTASPRTLTTDLARIRDSFRHRAQHGVHIQRARPSTRGRSGGNSGFVMCWKARSSATKGRIRVQRAIDATRSPARIFGPDRFRGGCRGPVHMLQDEVVGRLANSLGNC